MAEFIHTHMRTRSGAKNISKGAEEGERQEQLKEKSILTNDSLDTYALKIMIETNINNEILPLTNDVLYVSPEDIKEQSLKVSLNKYPYFTYKYEFPLSELKQIRNYKDRINIFFNESEFNRVMTRGIQIKNFEDENEKNALIEKNILTMLEILLPTKFPIVDNLHTSLDYVTNISSTNPLTFDKTKIPMFSHINLGGKEYTVDKVVLYNDIINHPLYYQLIKNTINFQNWAEQTGNEIYIKEPKSKFPPGKQDELQYINYENSELLSYKEPNRSINHQKFQDYINNHSKLIKNVNYVEKYHKLIKYLYNRYFLGTFIEPGKEFTEEEINEFDSILTTRTGLCTIDTKDISNPTKEIYVRIETHDQKIDDSTVKDIKCYYYGEVLGNKLQQMILGISPKSYFVKETSSYPEKNASNIFDTSSKSGVIKNRNISSEKVDIKKFTEEDISKINNIFLSKLDEKWSNKPGTKKTGERIKSLLTGINEKVNFVSNKEYNSLKTRHDERDLIKDILKHKFLPVFVNNKQINGKLGKILLGWTKQLKSPNQYYKELIELLKEIDSFILTIKNIVSNNEIDLKSMKREGNKTYDKYRFLYNYQKEVLKLYEFVVIFVVYNTLEKLQKSTDYELPENKYGKLVIQGGKRTNYTRKHRINKDHRKTMKK